MTKKYFDTAKECEAYMKKNTKKVIFAGATSPADKDNGKFVVVAED